MIPSALLLSRLIRSISVLRGESFHVFLHMLDRQLPDPRAGAVSLHQEIGCAPDIDIGNHRALVGPHIRRRMAARSRHGARMP